eukprot:13340756-Ditylum_brightwellii.AAC.1
MALLHTNSRWVTLPSDLNFFRDKLERCNITLATEWREEVSVSIHDFKTFEDIRNAIHKSKYHQVIMDGDPRSGGRHLPRYCKSITLVCRDSTVLLEIITHSGGDDELYLDSRDLLVHIPNPSYVSDMRR